MSARPDPVAARWAGEKVDDEPEGAGAGQAGRAAGRDASVTADGPEGAVGDEADRDTKTAGDRGFGAGGEEGTGGFGAESEELAAGHEGPVLADVAALMAQRDEYLDSLQRLKADFDNYRKRVARLQEEQSARAAQDLVSKVLPVIDNLDLAWSHLGPADAGSEPATEEARALGQARRQLLEVLEREGLERVDECDVPFDPTVHDAVAHREVGEAEVEPEVESVASEVGSVAAATGDGAGGAAGHGVQVDEVMRAGYRWRGRVLRPAMVRVRG